MPALSRSPAKPENKTAIGTFLPPVAVFFICAFGMWEAHYYYPELAVEVPGSSALAFSLILFGLAIGAWAIVSFVKAKTTADPTAPWKASSLVTSGVYTATRNPMYLGLLTFLAAIALFLSNPLSFLLIPVFMAWMTFFQIRTEERALLRKFGEEYSRYREKTGRWFWKF